MSGTITRPFPVDLEVRASGDGRTVAGIVVPYNRTAIVSDGGPRYEEGFRRGAFAKTIREAGKRVKLLSQHNAMSNPLGRAMDLREDDAGLYGEFHVSKTASGDEALELLRDGALDSFSVGFRPVKHVKEGRVTWRTEVGLREVSLVTFPAYEDALVSAVRAFGDLSEEERREALALMATATDLRSVTSEQEPTEPGTSTEAAPASNEPTDGHSAARIHRQARVKAREMGVI